MLHDELLVSRALDGLYPEQTMVTDTLSKERLAKARARVARVSYKITENHLLCGAYTLATHEVEKAALMLGYERGLADGMEMADMLREGGAQA